MRGRTHFEIILKLTAALTVKLSSECNDSLQDMVNNIENTIDLWEGYLHNAKENEKPVVRRFNALRYANGDNPDIELDV